VYRALSQSSFRACEESLSEALPALPDSRCATSAIDLKLMHHRSLLQDYRDLPAAKPPVTVKLRIWDYF